MLTTFFKSYDSPWTHPKLDGDVEFASVNGRQVKSILSCLEKGTSVFEASYACNSFPPYNATLDTIQSGMSELSKMLIFYEYVSI